MVRRERLNVLALSDENLTVVSIGEVGGLCCERRGVGITMEGGQRRKRSRTGGCSGRSRLRRLYEVHEVLRGATGISRMTQ